MRSQLNKEYLDRSVTALARGNLIAWGINIAGVVLNIAVANYYLLVFQVFSISVLLMGNGRFYSTMAAKRLWCKYLNKPYIQFRIIDGTSEPFREVFSLVNARTMLSDYSMQRKRCYAALAAAMPNTSHREYNWDFSLHRPYSIPVMMLQTTLWFRSDTDLVAFRLSNADNPDIEFS